MPAVVLKIKVRINELPNRQAFPEEMGCKKFNT